MDSYRSVQLELVPTAQLCYTDIVDTGEVTMIRLVKGTLRKGVEEVIGDFDDTIRAKRAADEYVERRVNARSHQWVGTYILIWFEPQIVMGENEGWIANFLYLTDPISYEVPKV